jgi:hypothetical protein
MLPDDQLTPRLRAARLLRFYASALDSDEAGNPDEAIIARQRAADVLLSDPQFLAENPLELEAQINVARSLANDRVQGAPELLQRLLQAQRRIGGS